MPCFSMSAMRSASWNSGGGVVSPSHICIHIVLMSTSIADSQTNTNLYGRWLECRSILIIRYHLESKHTYNIYTMCCIKAEFAASLHVTTGLTAAWRSALFSLSPWPSTCHRGRHQGSFSQWSSTRELWTKMLTTTNDWHEWSYVVVSIRKVVIPCTADRHVQMSTYVLRKVMYTYMYVYLFTSYVNLHRCLLTFGILPGTCIHTHTYDMWLSKGMFGFNSAHTHTYTVR